MSAGEQVIAALNTAGIPAEAAYPGSKMPYLTAIAARVTEESESEGAVTVAVTLLCPFALGNEALKTAGENAANALKALGTVAMETMGFETRWDCYYRVLRLLIPAAPAFQIKQGTAAIQNALRFTAVQQADEKNSVALADAPWVITLEEEFSPEGKETVLPGDSFNLTVTRKTGVDIFQTCAWTSVRRVYGRDKMTQIRTGTAKKRIFSAVVG